MQMPPPAQGIGPFVPMAATTGVLLYLVRKTVIMSAAGPSCSTMHAFLWAIAVGSALVLTQQEYTMIAAVAALLT